MEGSRNEIKILSQEIESAISVICKRKLMKLYGKENMLELPSQILNYVLVTAREQPPPSTIGASIVYVMLRPDRKIYVGQTDDLEGCVHAHRSKNGMQNATFLYFIVSGKSIACELETLLINQLPSRGFQLTNMADGKHRNFGSSPHSLENMAMLRFKIISFSFGNVQKNCR